MRRLVVGITGATGSAYAVRLLEMARAVEDVETHLVVSASGVLNVRHELGLSRQQIHSLADKVYNIRDVGATLASGAFSTTGMVVVPCSMRTLAAVAMGLSDNLITRAADVTLKERRRLVMVVRETPPKLVSDDGRHTVIRPLAYVTETDLVKYAEIKQFPIIPCNLCGSQENLKRREVGEMLKTWERQHPQKVWNTFKALASVVPSHLMDRSLFDFANLQPNGQANPDGDLAFDNEPMADLPSLTQFDD